MRLYESVIALKPDLSDEQILQESNRLSDLINQKGKVLGLQRLGKRKLFIELEKEKEGFFIQINFDYPEDGMRDLKRAYKLNPQIIREFTIRKEPEKEKKKKN